MRRLTHVPRPPVFLFAYANDRIDDRRYLRDLPEERRRVRAALLEASDEERCDVIQLPNATVEEVLSECRRARRRLAVFHFAGHADAESLLFERADGGARPAGASAIADFLGMVKPRLVVLNGCSTREQVAALLAAGMPAVVATSSEIRDDVATDFAVRFYTALADEQSIGAAFDEASVAVKASLGTAAGAPDVVRSITREILTLEPPARASPAAWPWTIHGSQAGLRASLLSRRGPRRWLRIVGIAACVAVTIAGLVALAALYAGFDDRGPIAAPADARRDDPRPSLPAPVDAAPDAASPAPEASPLPWPPDVMAAMVRLQQVSAVACRIDFRHVRRGPADSEHFVRCVCGRDLIEEWRFAVVISRVVDFSGVDIARRELQRQCRER